MIGVQKRKFNNSSSAENTLINSSNNDDETIRTRIAEEGAIQVAEKSQTGRKRSKSSSFKQQNGAKMSKLSSAAKTTLMEQNGANSDESVWIFGLINNIEQLLSTFTSINTSSSSSSSSPSSSSSCSSSSSSSSSSASTSSTITPSSSFTSTAALSPASSCTASSTLAQQAPSTSIPRSSISRQIKFHEYKGPPSAKRPQPAQPNGNSLSTKRSSSSAPLNQAEPGLESKQTNCMLANRATSRQQFMPPPPPSTRQQLNFQPQQQHQHQLQLQDGSALIQSPSPVHIAPQQQAHVAQKQHQQPLRQRVVSLPATPSENLLTSVPPRCTFYINQNTFESSNGTSVLLAPFLEPSNTTTRHNSARVHYHQAQPQLQPQLQLQPQSQQQPQQQQQLHIHLNHQHGACANNSPDEGCIRMTQSTINQPDAFQNFVPFKQQPQSSSQAQAQSQVQTQSEQQRQLFYNNQPFYQPSDLVLNGFTSPQTNESSSTICDDLGSSFEPLEDSEDTDKLEPSIGSFCQGVDELLFSEFIDLQDVPMNVDESDWLKKFLPPCSMS